MIRKDPLGLLEAAYSFVPDEQAWLRGLVDALTPYDLGGGILAYASDLGATLSVRTCASMYPGFDALPLLQSVCKWWPANLYRRLHSPMPTAFSADTIPRAAKDVGLTHAQLAEHLSGVDPSSFAAWGFCGGDANRETVFVALACTARESIADRDRVVLDHFSAHLGSALRLRSVIGKKPDAAHASVDAVIAPDGRLLDLRADAEPSRGVLIDAVMRSERARLRRAEPEERLRLFTALVDGQWSIIETVERDGKRMLLLCRNEPRTAKARALTSRERAILQLAALGHTYKHIAYELGVALPTVAASLKLALRKLGLKSRAELVRVFARAPDLG